MASAEAIRKAFERRLLDAIAASAYHEKVILAFPNLKEIPPPEGQAELNLKVRPTLHGPKERPATMGLNPRKAKKGFFKIGVLARPGTGTDDLDALAEILKEAYPYDSDLSVGGVKVQIDGKVLGDLLEPPTAGSWPYRALDLNWSIGI